MEVYSLQPTNVHASASSRNELFEKTFNHGLVMKFPRSRRFSVARKLKLVEFKSRSAGKARISLGVIEAVLSGSNWRDEDLVFVAGATGRVGSRTVRELLKLGFRVRAGVRSAEKAQPLVQSVKEMKIDDSTKEEFQVVERLEVVECDLEKPDQIKPAIGNASVVICCIGASEKEVFDVTGPYRIDYLATKNLIDAAAVAKVNHFIMVSSLGTNKVGFPAAILNLFWGVLIWKRKAEEALLASGVPYTIVRPGGMERPTDSYKETHNITLSEEDTLFGGQVSNLQVAELMSVMAKNRQLSYCKVVEVIAETTAPLTPAEELLKKISSQRPQPKVPDTVIEPPVASNVVVSEPQGAPVEIEAATKGKMATSPYVAYDDLRPPTSPTPTPSCGKKVNANVSTEVNGIEKANEQQAEQPKEMPLSPYTAYDELKPSSSPSPSPKEVAKNSSTADKSPVDPVGGNDVASGISTSVIENDHFKDMASYRSPYFAYDDFKPPTSPTPSTPSVNSPLPTSIDI